ncbi:MAG: ADP-ribosylglycohydrolase family protein [Corynebacterium sp.]|nr:ADP-ribosylglycohydrolase family protein [Corynebacterium sp.]
MNSATRARGTLLGQAIGDSLGSSVEFSSAAEIAAQYPHGVRELVGSTRHRLMPGQPTDDTEMALALARSIVHVGGFDVADVCASYERWVRSDAFAVGRTIHAALVDHTYMEKSQANGALMRISPLAIYGAGRKEISAESLADAARQDAHITHTNQLCQDINAVFVVALARIIHDGLDREAALAAIETVATTEGVGSAEVAALVAESTVTPPADYLTHMGWVRVAFGNAVWELAHTDSFEESLVRTVGRGGDTDTNAAITGALLGGVYGQEGIPERWREAVIACRPTAESSHPRPEEYWPTDIPQLADALLAVRGA